MSIIHPFPSLERARALPMSNPRLTSRNVVRHAQRERTNTLVAATLAFLGACSSAVEPTSASGVRLVAVSATQLVGTVGASVTPAPTVLATDASGTPLQGELVTAEITGGNGTVGSTVLKTDGEGRASASWTLGVKAGVQSLTLRAGLAPPLTFTAEASPGEIDSIIMEGTGQAADPGAMLPDPLTATVRDRFGNPIPGVAVTFAVLSGGGSIDEAPRITDAAGVARSGRWTLGPEIGPLGTQRVRVRSGSIETIVTARTYGCWESIPGSCTSPVELVFSRPSDHQLYRIRTDGSGLTRLTTSGSNHDPAWSPDGRRIAFIHNDDDRLWLGDVWFMNADGSNPARYALTGDDHASVAWSPDGTRLIVTDNAFGTASDDYRDAFTMSVIDATGSTTLLFTVQQARMPAWSPEGNRIAFVRSTGPDEYETVWLVNADGTGETRLTFPDWPVQSRMAWSPDGSEIIYPTSGRVYAVRADGSGKREIASSAFLEGVQVSPDGRWLGVAFRGPELGRPNLGYLPIGGGVVAPIVGDAYGPSWHP